MKHRARTCLGERGALGKRAIEVRHVGAAFALAVTALTVGGCGQGTGGRRVRFELDVEAEPLASFVTATGWTVSLDEACVALGPATLYAGAPVTASVLRRASALLVGTAHAHPGADHFDGGEVRGEWVSQVAFDAVRAPRVPLGSFEGIAGPVSVASLEMHPLRAEVAGDPSCLRGHQAYVAGVARRDGETVRFEGGLDLEAAGGKRLVSGIPATFELDEGVRVRIVVDPRAWLDGARFETLGDAPARAEGRRITIDPDSQVRAAWFVGARSARAFRVEQAGPERSSR